MSLLVTGSIGLDTLETPAGKRDNVLGGSAIYFSYAASFFSPVRLVGVVGDDFPQNALDLFKGKPIDTTGLERRAGSKTFRWHGSYLKDLNEAVTVEVDLNVLAERAPKIPASALDSKFIFLANTHPALQQSMLADLKHRKLVVADTMNLWIQTQRPELLNLLKQIDGLVLNDGEAKLLTEEKNIIKAARQVLALGQENGGGLKFVVCKKGEHGSLLVTKDETFVLPAFPADAVVDPTGAGDSFAGGMMGYLASHNEFTPAAIKKAIAYGTVTASYTIADFSLAGLTATSREKIDARLARFQHSTTF